MAYWRIHVCDICGREYWARSSNQKYCSQDCKDEALSAQWVEQYKRRKSKVSGSENMRILAEMVKDDPNYGRFSYEDEHAEG